MPPQRPRAKYTSEVAVRLREEVGNQRGRIIQAVTAIHEDLPREAGAFLDSQPPAGYPAGCTCGYAVETSQAFWFSTLLRSVAKQ
jgi:hypothetical protein